MKKYAIYIRVSTGKQGESGLGLNAQERVCREYIPSESSVEVFSDVSSGGNRSRPGLLSAVEYCKNNKAELVIAKLDRLARDVEFTFMVVNNVKSIHFCDMPMMNTMILGVFASVAQYEKELIGQRTSAALDSISKEIGERGYHTSKAGNMITKLGCPKTSANTGPAVEAARIAKHNTISNDEKRRYTWQLMTDLSARYDAEGKQNNLQDIADTLNNTGHKTPTGKNWSKAGVSRALKEWGKYFD